MRTPQSIPELRRFLGMVNQLGKFSPVVAQLTKPLRELFSKKTTWLWGTKPNEAFRKIKSKPAMPRLKKRSWPQHGLFVCEGLLLYGTRIVVPKELQHQTLCKIHHGHIGIEGCCLQVTTSVWWPEVSSQMETHISQFSTCARLHLPTKEPLLPSVLTKHPWEKVAFDLFEFKGKQYLLVVDYYSSYPEVIQHIATTSSSVISSMKSIFSRHGIPRTVVSENGPQYNSTEVKDFASSYGFNHVTSSPHYRQSNALAERAVKTVKGLLEQTTDSFLALLTYRATPFPWCELSLAELLMGR